MTIDLSKMNKYFEENPTSDETNLKRLNAINEREKLRAKEEYEKISKMMNKADKKIKKMEEALFFTK